MSPHGLVTAHPAPYRNLDHYRGVLFHHGREESRKSLEADVGCDNIAPVTGCFSDKGRKATRELELYRKKDSYHPSIPRESEMDGENYENGENGDENGLEEDWSEGDFWYDAFWCMIGNSHFVILFWIMLFVIGIIFAPSLIDECKLQMKPVPGSPSDIALTRLRRDFPLIVAEDIEVVAITCAACQNIGKEEFARRAVNGLRGAVQNANASHPDFIKGSEDYYAYEETPAAQLTKENPYISMINGQKTMIFMVKLYCPPENVPLAMNLLDSLAHNVQVLDQEGSLQGFRVELTGALALFRDTMESTKKDLHVRDLIVIPLAFGLLYMQVCSWRLLLLPALSLVVVFAISFGFFVPVAKYLVDISPLTPSVMAFLNIALSVDYSLFQLTRFTEEISRGNAFEIALWRMQLYSGRVIGLSGAVIIICSMCTTLFPGEGISTIGVGTMHSTVCSLSVVLTLTPCVLSMFPEFFQTGIGSTSSGHSQESSRELPRVSLDSMGADSEAEDEDWELSSFSMSIWYTVSCKLTSRPWIFLIPVIVYCTALPAAMQLKGYSERFDNELTFPREGKATQAYQHLKQSFPPGILNPIHIILTAPAGQTVANENSFHSACLIMQSLITRASMIGKPWMVGAVDLLSVAALPTRKNHTQLECIGYDEKKQDATIPLTAAQMLSDKRDDNVGLAYKELWHQQVSEDMKSMLITLRPSFDPFGLPLKDVVLFLRESLANTQPAVTPGLEILLFSPLVNVYDIVKATYDWLPYIVAVACLGGFILVGVSFGAAFAPVKLFLTVVIPIVALYGLATAVYQRGLLNWTHITSVMSTDGIFWANPVFTMPLLLGLALDYDMFLFSRVLELRSAGYDDRSSVIGGLVLTGPVITSAGLIMASAFLGLLLTEVPSTNQLGFLLCAGVLIDTFIIRLCLVPSILILTSRLNYWPLEMPKPYKYLRDLQAFISKETQQHG